MNDELQNMYRSTICVIIKIMVSLVVYLKLYYYRYDHKLTKSHVELTDFVKT